MNIRDNISNNKNLNKSVRDRLLDTAEQLFADKGFDGTSIREITAKANTNIAAVNYHFGGKENLYIQVFQRRMSEMRNIRISSIEKVMSQTNHETTLEELIREFATAFIEPLIDKSSGRRFMNLMINEMANPHLPRKMFVEQLVTPTLNSLGKGLMQLCPGLNQQKAVLSIVSIVGQLLNIIHVNEMFEQGNLIDEKKPSLSEMLDHIVQFSAAGIRAAAQRTD